MGGLATLPNQGGNVTEDQKQKELQKMRDEDRRSDEFWITIRMEKDIAKIVRDFNSEITK